MGFQEMGKEIGKDSGMNRETHIAGRSLTLGLERTRQVMLTCESALPSNCFLRLIPDGIGMRDVPFVNPWYRSMKRYYVV